MLCRLKSASFDTVIADNVLEHASAPLDALRELRRVMRSGGRAYVLIPLDAVTSQYQIRTHLWKADERSIRRAAEWTGLDVVELQVLEYASLDVYGCFPASGGRTCLVVLERPVGDSTCAADRAREWYSVCGIVGSFNPLGESAAPGVVERMRDRMAHRGPDGAGLWRSPRSPLHARTPAALDHRSVRRRGAADAQRRRHGGGHVQRRDLQPRVDLRRELEALGKYEWTTDHSDTEVLLHAYEEWGLDCVHRFYGMFAFARLRRARSRRARCCISSAIASASSRCISPGRRPASGCSPPRSGRCSRIRTSRRRWIAPPSGTT